MCFSRIRSSGSSSSSSSTSPSKSSRSMGRPCPSGYRFAHNEEERKLAIVEVSRRGKIDERGKTKRQHEITYYRVAVRRLTDSQLTVRRRRRRRRRRRSSRSQPWPARTRKQAGTRLGEHLPFSLFLSLSLPLGYFLKRKSSFLPRTLCRWRGRVLLCATYLSLSLFLNK